MIGGSWQTRQAVSSRPKGEKLVAGTSWLVSLAILVEADLSADSFIDQ